MTRQVVKVSEYVVSPNWYQIVRNVDGADTSMLEARTQPDGTLSLRYEVFAVAPTIGRVEYMTLQPQEAEAFAKWLTTTGLPGGPTKP